MKGDKKNSWTGAVKFLSGSVRLFVNISIHFDKRMLCKIFEGLFALLSNVTGRVCKTNF